MKYPICKLAIKILVVFILVILSSCKPDTADNRLLQLETIVGKWENELRSRAAGFEDLVYIQTDITAYDIDEQTFESEYGNLSDRQQTRLADIRMRFKKLMRKNK
ncbi:MAG: hypothetical protein ABIN36_09280 [Ferruginibacter sp.]